MAVVIRFNINAPSLGPPSYEEIASALARQGVGSGDEHPEFLVWGTGSYPDSTVVEYLRSERFATALHGVNRAIDAAGIRRYCTGGDLHLPATPIG
jgi:hypothetical protein